jgi:VWFA-related protein
MRFLHLYALLAAFVFLLFLPQVRAQQTQIDTEVDLVLVDVVVTDHGTPVRGIDKSRFRLFENGKEERVASFDENRPDTQVKNIATTPMLPPNTYTNLPGYHQNTEVNVLLLDALNTPLENQFQLRKMMVEYIGKIPKGTPLAIFTLSTRLRMAQGFTTDQALLLNALKAGKNSPSASVAMDNSSSSEGLSSMMDDLAQSKAAATTHVSSLAANIEQFEAETAAFRMDVRVQMTIDALGQLSRYLSAIPGRKNLIWLSGSFPIALDPDTTLNNPMEVMRSYSNELHTLSTQMASARVAVYPIDARGLMNLPSFDASTASENLTSIKRRSTNDPDVKFLQQTASEHDTMAEIARATGGKEFVNNNDLIGAIASVVENGSSYYTLGYHPSTKKKDGKYHNIQVRLDGANYNLSYRRGYYADSAVSKPAAINASVEVPGTPWSSQIQLIARVLPASDPNFAGVKLPDGGGEDAAKLKSPSHYIVDLIISPSGITFDLPEANKHHCSFEAVVLAFDSEGKQVNFTGHGYQLNLTDLQYQQITKSGMHSYLGIDLHAGDVTLRLLVKDSVSGRTGSLEVPVHIETK